MIPWGYGDAGAVGDEMLWLREGFEIVIYIETFPSPCGRRAAVSMICLSFTFGGKVKLVFEIDAAV